MDVATWFKNAFPKVYAYLSDGEEAGFKEKEKEEEEPISPAPLQSDQDL